MAESEFHPGGPQYREPKRPFSVDSDHDICDANGWLVCCPAYTVWPGNKRSTAVRLCAVLNGEGKFT